MKRFLHILTLVLLTMSSCVREDVPVLETDDTPRQALVSLNLRVAGCETGTSGTKAMDDPSDIEIKNLCIMQFEGTDDSSRIIGDVHYIQNTGDVMLADSDGKEHTLVILANTFTKIPKPKTLGEIRKSYHTLETLSDLFGSQGRYYRLNGTFIGKISDNTSITATLKRSMAKINISIENTGTDNLKIESIQLCNIARKDHYLTTGDFQDVYNPSMNERFDDVPYEWNGDPSGTGTATYSFNIPANMRGVDETVTSAQKKNKSDLTVGSTYVRITGVYGDQQDIPIVYTFYLGSNLVNDFNIRPNTIYNYLFTFDGKGDCNSDSRIEDMGPIDINIDSNCYILNPPSTGSQSYTFNVVHRPNIFWGDRYSLAQKYPNFQIDGEKNWYAVILWSDIKMSAAEADAFLVRKVGNGSGNYGSDSQRVKVTIPSGISHGNVVIGVYVDTPETILWSWHLWITDYNPDFINGRVPVEGQYVYPVTGGEVHRYAGSGWQEGGMYENGYAMDRNLGATFQKTATKGSGLYYQFGRKDPFPGDYSVWTYYESAIPTEHNNVPTLASETASTDKVDNVAYAVTKPRTFLTNKGSTTWIIGNPFNKGAQNEWLEPCPEKRGEYEETGGHRNKSFFDPCPPGWRLPGTSAWIDDFMSDSSGTGTTDPLVNVILNADPHGRGSGFTYYPRGYLADRDDPDAPTVFFPLANARSSTGGMSGATDYSYYLRCTYPHHTVYNYIFSFYRGAFSRGTTSYSTGTTVRCVKENY